MSYRITQYGIDQVKDFNSCLSDLCEHLDSNLTNKITEEIDSHNILIKDFENLLGYLGREALFDYSPMGSEKPVNPDLLIITEAEIERVDTVNHDQFIERLVDADYLEDIDDEEFDFLTALSGNMVDGKSLIDAIIETIDGMEQDDIDIITTDMMASRFPNLNVSDKLFIINIMSNWDVFKLEQMKRIEIKLLNN